MAHVADDMKELDKIVAELKVLNAKAKDLRTRKKELEGKILEYLEQMDSPGLKFNQLVVLKTDSTTHTRMKKAEKKESIIKALEEQGIQDAEKVYDSICKAGVGEEKTARKLKVKTVLPEVF
jgi:cell division septum initiation protein DivIVA